MTIFTIFRENGTRKAQFQVYVLCLSNLKSKLINQGLTFPEIFLLCNRKKIRKL